jgi:hypothetical protein
VDATIAARRTEAVVVDNVTSSQMTTAAKPTVANKRHPIPANHDSHSGTGASLGSGCADGLSCIPG